MKQIFLSGRNKNLCCIIDDKYYSDLSKYKWYLNHKGYAQRNRKHIKNGIDALPILMHVFILGKKKGFTTDHINNDKLDNRKNNLRFLTNTENIRRRGVQRNTSTGYKGVYLCKNRKKKNGVYPYQVYIRVDKKLIFVGYFFDKQQAALAYNEASKKYHGEFGYQNQL
jgi:hypothetical protein